MLSRKIKAVLKASESMGWVLEPETKKLLAAAAVVCADPTPVFIGCSDVDAHIPLERVHETAETLGRLGAEVDERIYPGVGHTIVEDEIEAGRRIVRGVGDLVFRG